ncbi:phage tail tip lysozyme [Streptococcus loxodontisalivarius]|uniref:Surface antigen n=1 Tax=Streptococcus loxodontisalivarius TaxID=1349415 RepID=A0ABS2PPT4_9STRE|nr:phage tail tip lysozyme [Streptococcus loxodontisalivarius]MBM7642044.1 surface antigen [Streptococcus loxodontisalivarius]
MLKSKQDLKKRLKSHQKSLIKSKRQLRSDLKTLQKKENRAKQKGETYLKPFNNKQSMARFHQTLKQDSSSKQELLEKSYQTERDKQKMQLKDDLAQVPPKAFSAKSYKTHRLKPAKQRYRLAKQNLKAFRVKEKQSFKGQRTLRKVPLFREQSQKSVEQLQLEKELSHAKTNLKQSKRIYGSKRSTTQSKRFLRQASRDLVHLVSQDDDLDGLREIQDKVAASKRYSRFLYDAGRFSLKSGQASVRLGKNSVKQVRKTSKALTAPFKKGRFKQKHLKTLRQKNLRQFKSLSSLFQPFRTFFTALTSNPLTWLVSGILLFVMLMMGFFISVTSNSLIQQDEFELTKAYQHMTWEDAEHTRTNETGITYFTKIDDVMVYMNYRYQDYELNQAMDLSLETYQSYLSQLWSDLNAGSAIKSMKDLYQNNPDYKLSDEEKSDLSELSENGVYDSLQELDNPFEGQSNDDSLQMTYRYGYYHIDGKPSLQSYIVLEAKSGQTIVAPMDGKVVLDGENIVLISGQGSSERRLTLYQISTGRVANNQVVSAGEVIGQTKDDTGLKVTYQKYQDDKESLTTVNPAFYFPKVIQVQTTILPTIGQFGGDEFARAKTIYDYLKAKGATHQAIAAILGNWSVESSINPKRAEGDYLSPPVGASDSSWDDETWLDLGGPAIYNGAYPNILHRGLGLGQWTDTADGSRRHTLLLTYARTKNQKWYDLNLQLEFMMEGDSPYYTTWLKTFLENTGSPASLAQVFLTRWEGNSGDKLLERQTRATEWYYQIERGFSQPNGGTAQSDPKSLEAVHNDLYENSIPGGGDGMGYAYGQCTWGVAARINQLGLKLKGRNGEKIPIISTMGNGQDWVGTAARLGGETGSVPKEGAIISFAGGSHGTFAQYGHVSFVEKVYPDGSFLVSETNYNGNPNYTFRKISSADSAMSFAYTTK